MLILLNMPYADDNSICLLWAALFPNPNAMLKCCLLTSPKSTPKLQAPIHKSLISSFHVILYGPRPQSAGSPPGTHSPSLQK